MLTRTAHVTDIFSLAVTPTQLLTASGSSTIKVYSTLEPDFPQVQELEKVHRLGCHHLATSRNGEVAASAGFDGEVIIWSIKDEKWAEKGKILGQNFISIFYISS